MINALYWFKIYIALSYPIGINVCSCCDNNLLTIIFVMYLVGDLRFCVTNFSVIWVRVLPKYLFTWSSQGSKFKFFCYTYIINYIQMQHALNKLMFVRQIHKQIYYFFCVNALLWKFLPLINHRPARSMLKLVAMVVKVIIWRWLWRHSCWAVAAVLNTWEAMLVLT